MAGLLLGIDIGTTYCKALVLDTDGVERSAAREPTPWTKVATGAEIDPSTLLDAVRGAVARALADAPRGEVAAIGIAGMAETGVLLDGRGEPVCPAIAWHDVRGAEAALEIAAELGEQDFVTRTGLPVSALCTLSKLRWQREHLAGARAAVRWLGIPEWVAWSLGAAPVAELSLASRTGLLELEARTWWPEALAWLDVPDGFMAEPAPAGTPLGTLKGALPAARDAVIAVAGHDHLAAMVGAGATSAGDVLHSSGTAEVFVRTTPAPVERSRVVDAVRHGVTVGWHVIPDHWALLSGNELNVALAAILQLIGINGQAERDALDAAAAGLNPDDQPLRIVGLERGAPFALDGITSGLSPAHVWRAALAAGAELGAATLARSDAVCGPRARIVATGGGSRGAASRTVKEAWMGEIEWSPVQEATARGAALLGGVAAGLYASIDDLPAVTRAAGPPLAVRSC